MTLTVDFLHGSLELGNSNLLAVGPDRALVCCRPAVGNRLPRAAAEIAGSRLKDLARPVGGSVRAVGVGERIAVDDRRHDPRLERERPMHEGVHRPRGIRDHRHDGLAADRGVDLTLPSVLE
ncbi:MAG: hypothetical protein ACOYMM_12015 [Phycisphaerales bacterium]